MMKKILLLLCISFFVANISSAQLRGVNWNIADSIQINFQSGVLVSDCSMRNSTFANTPQECMASISNEAGNLLFYTNGFTVWNRNNQVMLNGDSLLCNYSETNGVLILPKPLSDSLFYIIYINSPAVAIAERGLSYSVVNMNGDGGLGAIVDSQKNIPLLLWSQGDTLSEKLYAVKHGNGRDWWIVCHDRGANLTYQSKTFYKILITPDGISDPFTQDIGISNGSYAQGEICFSNQGNRLGIVTARSAEVFNFDRCTGVLSNDILLDSVSFYSINFPNYYGCSFSPSGKRFYVSDTYQGVTGQTNKLFQFDLNDANPPQTKTEIWMNPHWQPFNIDSIYSLVQHELAPDGKIYIVMDYGEWPDASHFCYMDMNLSVINQPDSLGVACDFQPYSVYLGGHRTIAGLPNMPNYNLGALEGSACDTLTSIQNEIEKTNSIIISPNPATTEIKITNLSPTENQISIINLLGQQVKSIRVSHAQTTTLPVSDLPAGIYVVTIFDGEKIVCKKFVKE